MVDACSQLGSQFVKHILTSAKSTIMKMKVLGPSLEMSKSLLSWREIVPFTKGKKTCFTKFKDKKLKGNVWPHPTYQKRRPPFVSYLVRDWERSQLTWDLSTQQPLLGPFYLWMLSYQQLSVLPCNLRQGFHVMMVTRKISDRDLPHLPDITIGK